MSKKRLKIGRVAITLMAISVVGCTGGRVLMNGNPVTAAEIILETCDSAYFTEVDSQGYFFFNPFSPSSSDFDEDKFIPPGPIAITVLAQGGNEINYFVTRRNHIYDSSCPVVFNGVQQNQQCKIHIISMQNMDPSEANDVLEDFEEQDCT